MTNFDLKTLMTLAHLPDDAKHYARYLSDIQNLLGMIEHLNSVSIDNVEPLTHPFAGSIADLRPDCSETAPAPETILQNAPDKWDHFFKTPSIIEQNPSSSDTGA